MSLPYQIKKFVRYTLTKFKYGKRVRFPYSCSIGLQSSFEGCNVLHPNSVFFGEIGYGSFIGAYSIINSNSKIGRFTSIGKSFKVITGRHPYTYPFVTTSPMFYSLLRQSGKTFVKEQKYKENAFVDGKYSVVIGNDVWINDNVSIISGTRIGDGAILLANTVVTKDVPPYAIVGGIPAKIIKYRYCEDDIKFLLQSKWWNKPIDWIEHNADYFSDFEKLKNLIRSERQSLALET